MSFIQQSQNPLGYMFRTSLESVRAPRIKFEQLVKATVTRLQEATEAIRESHEVAWKTDEQ